MSVPHTCAYPLCVFALYFPLRCRCSQAMLWSPAAAASPTLDVPVHQSCRRVPLQLRRQPGSASETSETRLIGDDRQLDGVRASPESFDCLYTQRGRQDNSSE